MNNKQRIKAMIFIVGILLQISCPSIAFAEAEMQRVIFEDFSDYTGIYKSQILPQSIGVHPAYAYRDDRIGSEYTDEIHKTTLRAGYLAEPILKFDTLVDTGKLHVSFETMSNAVTERKMLIGFYDAKDGSTTVSDYTPTGYSQALFLDGGEVKYFGKSMRDWTLTNSGITYQENQWHKYDFLFDFDAKTGYYYIDGQQINATAIDPTVTRGFKALLFRVESTSAENAYLDSDGAFFLDNLYVHQYAGQETISMTAEESGLRGSTAAVTIALSEELKTMTKENFLVVDAERGSAVDFDLTILNGYTARLTLKNISESSNYRIALTGVEGKLTGATEAEALIVSTVADAGVYYYEGFESMTDAQLKEEYVASTTGKTSVAVNEKGEKGLKVAVAGTKNTLKKSFPTPYTEDVVKLEFSISNSSGITVDFGLLTSISGEQYYLGKISGSNIYYKNESNNDVSTGCSFDITRQNKISLAVNKSAKTLTVVTGSKRAEIPYTKTFGDVYGVFFRISAAVGTETIWIDDVTLGNPPDAAAFFANFGSVPRDIGGSSVYQTNTIHGIKLNPAQPTVVNGKTLYYVTRANGSVYLDVDGGVLAKSPYQNITVKVGYMDTGYGWFLMRYKNQTGETTDSEIVSMENTHQLKYYTFTLWDIDVGTTVYDVEISSFKKDVLGDGVFTLSGRRFSVEPVYLNSVEISVEDTIAPIAVETATGQEGNIFYNMETPTFEIVYTNRQTSAVTFSAAYTVRDKTGERSGKLMQNTETYTIPAGEAVKEHLLLPVTQYGLYELEVSLSGTAEGKRIVTTEEIPFSMCVRNDSLNPTMGVGVHLNNYGDAETAAKLMTNAGLGLLRDDFGWRNYEYNMGQYRLSDRMTAELNVVKNYGLELLAILSPYNDQYDLFGSDFADLAYIDKYQTYVEKMLSEPLFQETVSMIEVINEPDQRKTYQGQYIHDNNDVRSDVYLGYLKATKDAVAQVGTSNPGKDYKIGAMVICSPISGNSREFVDMVLSKAETRYPGEKLFDTMSMHPYFLKNDPEIGEKGVATEDPTDSIGYQIEYFRSLLNGTPVYNHVTGTNEYITGDASGSNNFGIQEPFWLSEFGYSTARTNSEYAVGSEYLQAVKLIRGYNQIKLNRFEDKVWIYDLFNDGNAASELEDNFGLLQSHTAKVPYSAKHAYLAVANYNHLTAGATGCSNVYAEDYSFITGYDLPEGKVYMMYTSKPGGSTITYNLGNEPVSYYDILGNPIAESQIKNSVGDYMLTTEPYYAVVGQSRGTMPEAEIHLIDGMKCLDKVSLDEISKSPEILLLNFSESMTGSMYIGGYQNNMLRKMQCIGVTGTETHYSIEDFSEFKKCEELRILIWDSNGNLTPLCKAYTK